MCSNSYEESQPRIISKEQININTLFGDFSFPEFLCQNVTDKLVHQSGFTSLRTLAGCWAFPRDSLFVHVCEGFCSNRTAQPLANRSPYSSGFYTSTKFALQLLTSSKDWRKPPTGQPLGAALGQRKPFLCTTDPWEGERDVERAFGFPYFKKKGRGRVGAARKLTYPAGAGEPANSPVLAALLESRAAASAAAAPGVFLLHHPVLQPFASQRGVHRETIT